MSLSCIVIHQHPQLPDRIALFLAQARFFTVSHEVSSAADAVARHRSEPAEYFLVEMGLAGEALAEVANLEASEQPRFLIFGAEETYFLDRGTAEPVLFNPASFFPNLANALEHPESGLLKVRGKLEVPAQMSELFGVVLSQSRPTWMLMQPGTWSYTVSSATSDLLYVRTEEGIKRLPRKDLLVIEAQKDYLQFTVRSGGFRVLRSLKSVEAKLDPAVHCRVHRSFIVLLEAIHSIEQDQLYLDGVAEPVPIGPNYRKDLFARLEIL